MVPWMKQEGSALEVLGALAAAWWLLWGAWWLGHALIVYGLPQVGLGLGISLKKQGAWAVVTGATSGIGRSYAHELARRGLNIVLISRDMSKLCREAEEIERLHVNNVGMFGKNAVRKLLDQEDLGKGITDIINCNMLSVSQMTRIILPQMIARGCGVIINISSEFGKYPVPFTTMYGATKAFINSFSQSVAIEYQSSGVIVQTLTPLMVSSNMNQLETKRFVVMSPEAFVREALDTVGVSNFTSGCLIHFIQSLLLSPFFSNSKYIFWIVNFFQPLLRAFRRP
ncbi:very-long-chain 3-oxoacyl-CoA reductase-B-like isoform X2 [Dromiciops gliroides]|uniref:very-long-chain 3-oxoacyl-CoA reductase-B-like isoform X2 n=1 Tax=Dromiciops gliroides TaxID=33562 RepID=UPI001CC61B01|nr:very-long-chain 3-oxoacyl-CoA reductase-B-like isoform X2 [Dromiciops gliroides]